MPAYYLSMRYLPPAHFPTYVLRSPTVSLHVVDPRSMKSELLPIAYDLLQPWEHEAGLRAYGQPPPGSAMARELVEGACLPFVPAAIRVPGEPAIQHPQRHTPAHRQAFRDALCWARLEQELRRTLTRVA